MAGINAEHAVSVIERERHFAGEVGALEVEGGGRSLIDVGLHVEHLGIGLQPGIQMTLGGLDTDHHLLTGTEGVTLIRECVQGKKAVATAVPAPVDVVSVVIGVIAIDIERMARTRQVVVGHVHDGAACRQLILN